MPATLYNYMLVTFSRSMLAIMLATFSAILSAIMSIIPILTVAPKGRCQKKQWENVGILKKQGGGLPESHFHFLLFLTWETPQKKVQKCKINHRGVPHLGKIPTFSRFFFGNVPKCTYSVTFYL